MRSGYKSAILARPMVGEESVYDRDFDQVQDWLSERIAGHLGMAGFVLVLSLFVMRSAGLEKLATVEKDIDNASFRAFSVGFPFLTGGLWMGSFWAQEAWANYWGWDSKENTALITWLVYVVYVHLRMLGGYRGQKAMGVLLGGREVVIGYGALLQRVVEIGGDPRNCGKVGREHARRRAGDLQAADVVGRVAAVGELRHVAVLAAHDASEGIAGGVIGAGDGQIP